GLEGRVPFLDYRVVEFGLSLPDSLKVGSGQGKLFLKRWASRFIPEEHLFTPKKGFHVPVGEWLGGDFLDRLAGVLPANPAIAQWFRPAGVSNLVKSCQRFPGHARMLWAIIQFAVWQRIFMVGSGDRPEIKSDIMEYLV
ncbi:MAG: asparagine synthetase B, partial [Proteobacteria bacterium]|nr:asparagine synthetase B [Pseudomonadota bacterium]